MSKAAAASSGDAAAPATTDAAAAGDSKAGAEEGGGAEAGHDNSDESDSTDEEDKDPADRFSDEQLAWSKRHFREEKYAKYFKICSELKITDNSEQIQEMLRPRTWEFTIRNARFSNLNDLNDFFVQIYIGCATPRRRRSVSCSCCSSLAAIVGLVAAAAVAAEFIMAVTIVIILVVVFRYDVKHVKKRPPKTRRKKKKTKGGNGDKTSESKWHVTGTMGQSFSSPCLKNVQQNESRDISGFHVKVRTAARRRRPPPPPPPPPPLRRQPRQRRCGRHRCTCTLGSFCGSTRRRRARSSRSSGVGRTMRRIVSHRPRRAFCCFARCGACRFCAAVSSLIRPFPLAIYLSTGGLFCAARVERVVLRPVRKEAPGGAVDVRRRSVSPRSVVLKRSAALN
jgi:hypothetical protein